MKIADIVTLDDQAEFRSDVKLDAYDDPRLNLALLRSYLFSSAVPARGLTAARDKSAADVLRDLVHIYSEGHINRLALIANYGHGKSHLALALANYFGRATDSQELDTILGKLERVIGDKAAAATFRDFKRHRGEFLIIRLRGDGAGNLHAQFLTGLERGLAEHDATRGAVLPFWYETAADYLRNLSPDQRAQAEAYLDQHGRELALLQQDIAARRDVFDLTVETIRAATGIRPALHEVGLGEAVSWAVGEFVDTGRLGGILILFDEFSLFIEQHAARNAAAELQDLLNGIDTHRGKVAFLALAQADPDSTADGLESLSTVSRASLKKSLTRLERRFNLSTVMESVIDSYLKQSEVKWADFTKDMYVRGPLQNASDTALIHFRERYENILRWSPTEFDKVITKGCFPLHPVTTYLLCNMSLGAVSDMSTTRTMLGFVRDFLEERQPQPAYLDAAKRPNWILPVELIDYFEGRFPGDDYRAYREAVRAAGPDATPAQLAVLKALFLQQLSRVNPRLLDDQIAFLANAAGLSESETREVLRALSDGGAILWSAAGSRKSYSLFPITASPTVLEEKLKAKMSELRFNAGVLPELNRYLADDLPGLSFGSKGIEVKWGHADDWGASEQVVTIDGFSAVYLRERIQATRFGPRGELIDGSASYVFWLTGRTDEEVEQMRAGAQTLLDEVCPNDWAVPVVLILPERPEPDIIRVFQRWRATKLLSNNERREIGPEMLRHDEDRQRADIGRAMRGLRGTDDRPFDLPREATRYVVPRSYRARIAALPRPTLARIIVECYQWAYPFRPPSFDTRYRAAAKGGGPFKTAVTKIAGMLLSGSSHRLPSTMVGSDASMMKDIVSKQLQNAWRILDPECRVQVPKVAGIQNAWEYLDKTVVPGAEEVRLSAVLITLLNPPYGFDYNTATLLFAAWVGYNVADVQVYVKARQVKLDELSNLLNKSTKDFFKQVHDNVVMLTRRDLNEVEREIRAKLEGYDNQNYTPDDVQATIDMFRAFADDQRADMRLREQVTSAANRLQADLRAAEEYDEQAVKIHREMQNADLKGLLALRKQVSQLSATGLVTTDSPPPAEIQKALDTAIEESVNRSARDYGRLDDINNYSWNKKHLEDDRKALQVAGLTMMVEIVQKAIDDLDTAESALRVDMSEKPVREMIQAMRVNLPLVTLYDQRQTLTGLKTYGPRVMELKDAKLKELSAAISRLEQDALEFAERILAHTTTQALEADRERLMGITYLYEGTPLAEELTRTKKLIDHYLLFLGTLDNVGEATRNLSDAETAGQLRLAVERLGINNAAWLGENQKQMLYKARDRIDAKVTAMEAEATKWLKGIESAIRSNHDGPVKLLERTRRLPPFLSAEQQAQLEELQQRLETQIDQDVVAQIEREFRKIRDPQKRRECIRRLEQLVNEIQTGSLADRH